MDDSNGAVPGAGAEHEVETYTKLLLLDEMESLLEELEEANAGDGTGAAIPADLRLRMDGLGVKSVEQLRRQLTALHAELDAQD